APDALLDLPGRDLLGATPSPFSPLVAARARPGGDDLVVLASDERRYAWRLDGARDRLRFLGRWGRDGRPSGEPVPSADGEEAIRWLARYLASLSPD
ncbi:hypothetical protein K2X89_17565, partial [Myxococcota bacterium]|nr:hypothetical protein [Myxococcota bacterium]